MCSSCQTTWRQLVVLSLKAEGLDDGIANGMGDAIADEMTGGIVHEMVAGIAVGARRFKPHASR